MGILVALYIDDILVTSSSRVKIKRVKDALNKYFYMTDLGPYSYYLGMIVS